MTDQSQQVVATATASGQSPPPEIIESIRKLQIKYAELGVEIEKLDEKIEKLREERSDVSSEQSDVMQQIRMFEQAASESDDVVAVDGVSIAESRRQLPDIDFKRWEDAPITELGLTDIEGLGRAKRQALLEKIPTLGAFQDLLKEASIRCMPLCEVLPKGIGRNTADAIEEKFHNWLDKNRGSYGLHDEKADVIPLEIDGTARAAKLVDELVKESESSGAASCGAGGTGRDDNEVGGGSDGDGLAVDLTSVDLEFGDDEGDCEEDGGETAEDSSPASREPVAVASPDCDEFSDTDADEPADRPKGRGRPKGSMDRTPRAPRKKRAEVDPEFETSDENDETGEIVDAESVPVEPSAVSPSADKSPTPPDETEFMFPEDTIEYLMHRYGQLLKTRHEPREIHDMGIYQSGVDAAHRGWTLEDCNWAPGDNQDDWLQGFISANGKPMADKKNEPSAID